ncbi:hypothetical protein [Bartonella senegalensis]|uniref:hypothetical protein n=1 Tax=Bartonella senegalensis TaxID=1468418 RepID=UPI0002D833A2|nr:hypothetical protein [Bartonella senegalensis]
MLLLFLILYGGHALQHRTERYWVATSFAYFSLSAYSCPFRGGVCECYKGHALARDPL